MRDSHRKTTPAVPRVTLRAVLVAFAFLACLLALWNQQQKLEQVQQQLSDLRRRGGHLEIGNVDQVHVVHCLDLPLQATSTSLLRWTFRCFVPEKKQVRFHFFSQDVPPDSELPNIDYAALLGSGGLMVIPNRGSPAELTLDAGEYLLSLSYVPDEDGRGNLKGDVTGSFANVLPFTFHVRSDVPHSWSHFSKAVGSIRASDLPSPEMLNLWMQHKTIPIAGTKPHVLLRYAPITQVTQPSQGSSGDPGILVWAETLTK
jgi:hypothetical protein